MYVCNGNPLQCSCLENPRDGGAWWAAVCGVAQSWTRLKRLSSVHTYMSFPGGASGKESACKAGDTAGVGLTPGWGRSPGGGHGNWALSMQGGRRDYMNKRAQSAEPRAG